MAAELAAIGIVKRYGSLVANDHVDLAVERGEVHAVMGENGAGKSTLMSILYGMQAPDEGRILLLGREVRYRSALDAIAEGVSMVHQAFKLFNSLTVWENVVYGREPQRAGFLDRAAAIAKVGALAQRYHLGVDPGAIVGRLSVGVRQRVEILKALYRDARILILDEPTAVLTPQERDALFAVIRNLTASGRTVIFVTHKLHEAMAIGDRVTVLRDGRVAASMTTKETSPSEIIRAMTGRAVNLTVEKGPAKLGAAVLKVDGLTVRRRGQAGGRPSELRRPRRRNRRDRRRRGQWPDRAYRSADGLAPARRRSGGNRGARRHEDGRRASSPRRPRLHPRGSRGDRRGARASAADNLAMGFHRAPPLARRGLLDHRALAAQARRLIARFGVRIGGEAQQVGSLSGGNLQKLVVARELTHEGPLLIAEQPTRGVDVGATEFIHGLLIAERDKGRATLLVSAELNEIMALSDRILVMFEGRVLADMPGGEADEETLGFLMAGRIREAA